MSAAAPLQNLAAKPQPSDGSSHAGLLLQRKCACGSPTASLTGECTECKSKKRLQTKLAIGASHDPLEREADRVADQVLAAPADSSVSSSLPRIQRHTGQATDEAGMAPASVDRVLSGAGRPLEPALRQDMERRFGHDFSRVRVHSGMTAGQSARDVGAHAYAVGQHIVFGAGRFAPATQEGRRLLAHELTHVVQQSGFHETRTDLVPHQHQLPGVFHRANGRLIQRDGENANLPGAFDVPTLNQLYTAAVQAARTTGNWQDAAEKLNGFNRDDIHSRLAELSFEEVAYLHVGALDNPRVGPDSQVAQLTKPGAPRASGAPRETKKEPAALTSNATPSSAANSPKNNEDLPMGGTYDDYKSNPDYIDNFSSAGYDPHSKTLHLFFEDGGEAVLVLPLQPSGGITLLVFERKSLLDNPGPNDRKIYPTSRTQRTLPTVAQWLADHAEEMQQSDLLLQAGVRTLDARTVPPNLWWLALLAPAAGLSARFASGRMRPAFKTVSPEPGEIPIIKAAASKGAGSTGSGPLKGTGETGYGETGAAGKRLPVPRPLEGGKGGDRARSSQAAGQAPNRNMKGNPEGSLGARKPETTPLGQDIPARGENLNADALNRHIGVTVQSPEHVPEFKDVLATAKRQDGLDPAKNPDHLVQGPGGVWRVWDSATMSGDTATVESALRTIGDKVGKGQSVRIVLNLDGVKNDGTIFARELKAHVAADRLKPAGEQISRGVKQIIVVKGGAVIHVFP